MAEESVVAAITEEGTDTLRELLAKSRKNPVWEAIKRAPSGIPRGFKIGAFVGLLMALSCVGLSYLSHDIPLLGGLAETCDDLLSHGKLRLFFEWTLLHGLGHGLFDSYIEGKSAHQEANEHNKDLVQIEQELAMIEKTLEQRLPDLTPEEQAALRQRVSIEAQPGAASATTQAAWAERIGGKRAPQLETWQERLLAQQTVLGPSSPSIH